MGAKASGLPLSLIMWAGAYPPGNCLGQHQSPIRRLYGNDFPIGMRQAVLKVVDTIPKTPTHVMIRQERVRERLAADAEGERELPPGMLLRVVQFESGWASSPGTM